MIVERMMMRVSMGFICVGNSCRSQMAEGFARYYGDGIFCVYSAGTHPAATVSPEAVVVMKEKDIDISGQHPKSLSEIPEELDVLITMGCGVECPYIPAGYREDWGIQDPVGLSISDFRRIRDTIEARVKKMTDLARDYDDRDIFLHRLSESNNG